jgi:hypothetical protein
VNDIGNEQLFGLLVGLALDCVLIKEGVNDHRDERFV